MGKFPGAFFVFPEYLAFGPQGFDGGAVLPPRGVELPVEFRDGGIADWFDGDFRDRQGSGREQIRHRFLIEVCLDLLPTLFVAEGVKEGDIAAVRPDLAGEGGIGGVDGNDVPVDHRSYRIKFDRGAGFGSTGGESKCRASHKQECTLGL